MKIPFLLLVLCLAAFRSTTVSAASFNCAAAHSPMEKTICGNAELSSKDETLNRLFKRDVSLLSEKSELTLRADEKSWLREITADCMAKDREDGADCLSDAFDERIDFLLDAIQVFGDRVLVKRRTVIGKTVTILQQFDLPASPTETKWNEKSLEIAALALKDGCYRQVEVSVPTYSDNYLGALVKRSDCPGSADDIYAVNYSLKPTFAPVTLAWKDQTVRSEHSDVRAALEAGRGLLTPRGVRLFVPGSSETSVEWNEIRSLPTSLYSHGQRISEQPFPGLSCESDPEGELCGTDRIEARLLAGAIAASYLKILRYGPEDKREAVKSDQHTWLYLLATNCERLSDYEACFMEMGRGRLADLAFAQDPTLTIADRQEIEAHLPTFCGERSSDLRKIACADGEIIAAEKRITAAFRRLAANSPPTFRKQLFQDQHFWEGYLDEDYQLSSDRLPSQPKIAKILDYLKDEFQLRENVLQNPTNPSVISFTTAFVCPLDNKLPAKEIDWHDEKTGHRHIKEAVINLPEWDGPRPIRQTESCSAHGYCSAYLEIGSLGKAEIDDHEVIPADAFRNKLFSGLGEGSMSLELTDRGPYLRIDNWGPGRNYAPPHGTVYFRIDRNDVVPICAKREAIKSPPNPA